MSNVYITADERSTVGTSTKYNFGQRVMFDKKITVTALIAHNTDCFLTPRIYNSSGSLIASGSEVDVNSTGVTTLPLSSSVTLEANTEYTIALARSYTISESVGRKNITSGNYPSTTAGGITMTCTSSAMMSTSNTGYPNASYSSSMVWSFGVVATIANANPYSPSSLNVYSITTSSATLSASVSDPDGNSVYASFEVHANSSYTSLVRAVTGSTVSSGSTSTGTATSLSSGSTYYMRAKTFDSNGASSGWTNYGSFKTDSIPNAPNSVSGYATGATTATVYGTVSDPDYSSSQLMVEYGPTTSFGYSASSSSVSSGSTAYAYLSGLNGGTTYYYRTRTYSNGQYSTYTPSSGYYTFTTNPPNNPPNAPTNITANRTASGAALSATVSDPDSGNTVYAVFEFHTNSSYTALSKTVNGSNVSSGSTSNGTATGLTNGTTYYLRAKTMDGDGASSGYTNYGSFKVNSLPNAPTNISVTSSTAPTVKATVSDPDGDSVYVTAEIHSNSSYTAMVTMGSGTTVPSGGVSELPFSSGTLTAGATYYLRVKATDIFGSQTASWTNYGAFTANNLPSKPTFSLISNLGYLINSRPKFYINHTDADGDNATDIQIQWSTSSTFASINFDRTYSSSPTGFSGLPAAHDGTITYTPNFDLTPATWYMRAKVKDAANSWSDWSNTQVFKIAAVPWSDTIPVDAYGFKAQWLNDIATVIDNACDFRGLSKSTWTDGTITTSTDMKAIHITERRNKLVTLLNMTGQSVTWTDSTLSDRKGQHIIELRNNCLKL